ncbi:hypothetical protein H9649_00875 [Sporosarcina sp. Sa2YVA2]|uniref:Uncharacterized protein n=1 Tax=Sporosarcina quadrami TaxID=2762234 RepID=A0ABR8U4Z4_9BACL|nr:hypothetical protein [Sporosarcina quadrami]MBD7983116.1 hypothetical protein [Sporosarcina quadrami]
MESLIIFAVIGIISMLFKGKKPEEAQKQQRPGQPSAQPVKPDPMRKLKEMSQEMYKEIQREFQTEIEEPPSRQVPQAPQPRHEAARPAVTRAETRMPAKPREKAPAAGRPSVERSSTRESTHRGRLSAHGAKHVWAEPVEHHEMVPKNERDLIKGIIFSEILGPPKSKQ